MAKTKKKYIYKPFSSDYRYVRLKCFHDPSGFVLSNKGLDVRDMMRYVLSPFAFLPKIGRFKSDKYHIDNIQDMVAFIVKKFIEWKMDERYKETQGEK